MADIRLNTQQRHRAIVDAALPLFAERGFARSTTKEIARAAGVSEALLYKHFPSKEVLYQEILQQCGKCGDPILARLEELEPSTSTLVHVVYLILHRVLIANKQCVPDWSTRHRLLLNSLVEDGEFARLVFDLVLRMAFPIFEASLNAADKAGDLLESPVSPVNRFWFAHHLAAVLAFMRLPRNPLPHVSAPEELVAQAAWFALRGIGLRDEALKAHYNPKALALLHVQATPAQ